MIYMHVGFPKTASTTIQHFLAANANFLVKHKRVYPRLLETRADAYGLNPHAHNPLALELRRGAQGPAWHALATIVRDTPRDHSIVLSGETLGGCKPESLRSALGKEDVKIIFYIREFSKIVFSQYSQHTKAGSNILDFDSYLDDKIERRNFQLFDLFSKWCTVFGAQNMVVRLLEGRTLVGGDVRTDILDAVGVEGTVVTGELEMTSDANSSPGWKTLEIVRYLNTMLSIQCGARSDETESIDPEKLVQQAMPDRLTDFTNFLARPAAAIGKMLGFSERGSYLSQQQFDRCCDAFDAQMDKLQSLAMNVRVAHASRDTFVPRQFMPSIKEIPPDEVAEFLKRLMPVACWSLLSGQRRLSELIWKDNDERMLRPQ